MIDTPESKFGGFFLHRNILYIYIDKKSIYVKNAFIMKPYIHKVNYYETDRMGVTHHSNYFRFMEEARIDMMDQMGMGYDKMEEAGIGSPVMEIEGKYIKTTTFPDEIEITTTIEKMTLFKFFLVYEMRVNGELVFKGKTTNCLLDSNGKPVAVEKTFPDFYKACMAEMKN